MRKLTVVAVWAIPALVLGGMGCGSKKEPRGSEARLAAAQAKASSEAKPSTPPSTTPPAVKLEPFWDDPTYVKVVHDQKCPEGLEALFGGGANAAKLKASTFVAVLRGPSQLKLGEYNQAKGEYPIDVQGVVFCHAPDGKLISVALGEGAHAYIPGERDVGEFYWDAAPISLTTKVGFNESKEFREKNMLGMDARVVFKPGRTEVHKKVQKIKDTAEEAAERKKFNIPSNTGGIEDWGAGRLVHAQVLGVRVGGDQSRTTLVEKKK
jgi:hypothetical protein